MRCDPDKTHDAAEEMRGAAAEVAREAEAAEVQLLALAALDLERAAREFSEDATKGKKVGWGWLFFSSCKKKKGKGKVKDKDNSGLNDALLADSSSSTCAEPQPTPKVRAPPPLFHGPCILFC